MPIDFHQAAEVSTVSGGIGRFDDGQQEVGHDNEIPHPHAMWKLIRNITRNQPMAGKGSILINVKTAPNTDN